MTIGLMIISFPQILSVDKIFRRTKISAATQIFGSFVPGPLKF